ncbi:response regulator [Lutimonas sp.]|uniref:response regulator n=1 Tax=Lutimonas sp. TaxID=1872403 RepID=UPI003D9ADDA1
MFGKVLVAEDMDDISRGIVSTLEELGIVDIQQVQYCDDALLKIKKAALDGAQFELLITDLSFNLDHRTQKIASGDALASVVRQHYPEIKIIMYSIEDRAQKIRHLINDLGIHGYVSKGRHGLKDLSKSVELVFKDTIFLSEQISHALNPQQDFEVQEFDLILLDKLSKGKSQEEISAELKNEGVKPSSLSTIEKRLNKLKIEFKANNAIHLVAKAKDLGLI